MSLIQLSQTRSNLDRDACRSVGAWGVRLLSVHVGGVNCQLARCGAFH